MQDGTPVVKELPPGGALVVVVSVPAPLSSPKNPGRVPGRAGNLGLSGRAGNLGFPGRAGNNGMLSERIFVIAEVCEVVNVAGGVILVGHGRVRVWVAGLGVAVASDKGWNLWLSGSLE